MEIVVHGHCFQIELEFGKGWFLVEGRRGKYEDKNRRSKGRGPIRDKRYERKNVSSDVTDGFASQ